MKRIFALMLIITMIFSSIIVSGATITATSNTVTSVSIGLPKSYAGQNATVTVLQEGYDIKDLTDANTDEIVIKKINTVVLDNGEIKCDFTFDNLNKDYLFVVECQDILMKQIINPYLTPAAQFNKIWLNIENGKVTVNGKLADKSPDGVTIKLMKPSKAESLDYNDISHIMMAYIDSFGNISNKERKVHGYTFETDETGDCTLYIMYNGVQIYKRTVNPAGVLKDSEPVEELDIDFGLLDSYPALSGTTKERFEAAVAELPEEVKVLDPVEIKGDYEIYVAPDGNDNNDGSISKPLKTIEKAIQLRNLYYGDNEGVVIYLRGGKYQIIGSLNIDDTGVIQNEKPLIISSYNDEEVVLTNSQKLNNSAFKKITDQDILERLEYSVKDSIYVADFKDLGITDFSVFTPSVPSNVNIYANGEKLTVARWPNADNVYIGEIVNRGLITYSKTQAEIDQQIADNGGTRPEIEFVIGHGYKFPNTDERPLSWAEPTKAYVTGHLSNDFTLETLRIENLGYNETVGKNTIHLDGYTPEGANATPLDANGVATNQFINYYYFNILEELDSPGEFYVDKTNQKLYFYPSEPLGQTELSVVSGNAPIINLTNTSNIVINGLTLKYGSANGITINGGYQNIIQNCEISNMKGIGVYINAGDRNGIIHSTIRNNMGRAVRMDGTVEDRLSLTPRRNFMQNCLCYRSPMEEINSGVAVGSGVGFIISHNLIMNSAASPIGFADVQECIVEYNEIVGGPTNTIDSAGIYFGGGKTNRGNHIRYNYIHDLSKIYTARALTGIYFDFCSSGNYAYGNVIKGVPSGLYSHNGRENVFFNNLIIGDGSNKGPYLRDELNALPPLKFSGDFVISRGVNRLWAMQNYYYPSETNTSNEYIYNTVDKSEIWRLRYPTMTFYTENIKIIMEEFKNEGYDLDNHYVTDREAYLRRPYDAYYANNLAVTLPSDESPSTANTALFSEIPNQHIRLVGRSTNRTYIGDPGFVDAANDNYALKSGAAAFSHMPQTTDSSTQTEFNENLSPTQSTYTQSVTIPQFVAPPFEKMGLTETFDLDERVPVKAIKAISPVSHFNPADSNYLVSLKWTDSGTAHYYKVTIADNASFDNALSQYVNVPMCEFDISDLNQSASTFYWKVEGLGKTKAYGAEYETSSVFSFKTYHSNIEITSLTTDNANFKEQTAINVTAKINNNMAKEVTPVILFAAYDKDDNFVSYTPIDNITFTANQKQVPLSITVDNPKNKIACIKLMIWNDLTNSLMPYGKFGVVYSK